MPGVVWAGTDDGNLQVSRDGGATFTEVGKNLPGLPRATTSTGSRASTRRTSTPARRTSSVDGHRSDDLKPYVFVTRDYGKTFQSIAGNLPAYGNVQVVREDPKNKDLLYVGTEFGLFISLDGGKSWQKFMNNYPTVRTDDILVHPRDGDLIVATHGAQHLDRRRHHAAAAADAGGARRRTRRCSTSVRRSPGCNDQQHGQQVGGQKEFIGENAPRGAAINYYLKSAAGGDVKITIADANGRDDPHDRRHRRRRASTA